MKKKVRKSITKKAKKNLRKKEGATDLGCGPRTRYKFRMRKQKIRNLGNMLRKQEVSYYINGI